MAHLKRAPRALIGRKVAVTPGLGAYLYLPVSAAHDRPGAASRRPPVSELQKKAKSGDILRMADDFPLELQTPEPPVTKRISSFRNY